MKAVERELARQFYGWVKVLKLGGLESLFLGGCVKEVQRGRFSQLLSGERIVNVAGVGCDCVLHCDVA